ncbi:MAG: hypothetical protein GWM92_12275, partial [Gemmatimonadetes bacterium]|nr:HEAT repeat domain-containing protein [Gemmatimonadota bacterium]NIR79473.1 HEAT repeat domain-containing protein [Gemmatimonadota bacterium]NIT88143.1 HEAT repeat domain-containing protein [Gemmatimonadota bacterium]NIU31965.1 HEAT repeat domain-containing protein [Gemmatimonadota bacterium]NIU36577.1 hypothetical protein [Gemmatimonadota bacterium]
PYTGDAHYFEAFALYRVGGEEQLRRALDLLDEQSDRYSSAPTLADARTLRVRIRGALARRGDVEAYSDVEAQAREGCGPDQETRLMALSALQNMNPERAVPILREVLESRDECSAELRKRAVFLLSQKMTDESVEILLDLAHRNPDPDREVREAAVFWLSQVGSEEALDALVSILRSSDDPGIQEKALFALSQHRGERSGEVLREYVERRDAPGELREQAIFWLGQSPGGAGYLRSLYGRLESPGLREKVLFSVAQSGAVDAEDWLLARARDASEPVELRKDALFWLGQADGADAAEVGALYGSFAERELKEQVLFLLSQEESSEAVDALLEIARNETDLELKKKAVFWLGQSDDPRAEEFLLEILRGPPGAGG